MVGIEPSVPESHGLKLADCTGGSRMTAISHRAKTLIIALLVGIIALGVGIAVAHSDGTEIRITAMRHDDGRVEFAVQESEGEGWGERVLPRQRFFPATGREGRWLNSTPITVGVVDELEPATTTPSPTATATPSATATPATTPTATTDLVVTDFEWVAPTYASGGVRYVRASATVTNNTGDTLTEWSAAMTCFDAENDVRVASHEIYAYSLIALAHGESLRIRFTDYFPTGVPGECYLDFRGEISLTVAETASATPDLLVTSYDWQASTLPSTDEIDEVTASATVTNNTGQTLGEWSVEMRCLEAGVIVADDQLFSFSSLRALAHGEAARVEFRDLFPRGTPTDCELSFRGDVPLTY